MMAANAALRCTALTIGLVVADFSSSADAADPAAGKSDFNSACSICHCCSQAKNSFQKGERWRVRLHEKAASRRMVTAGTP